MSKLILCSGLRTKRPYLFAATGNRVYSIEELCYYISSHIYFIDMEMFSDSLIDWIGVELGLTERSEKLRSLKKHQADLKTILTAVLCSADYFTESEIKNLIKMVDEISAMKPIKRSCIRAFSYLGNNQFAEAAEEYERVLNSKEASDMTPEEYGDILHNLAIAKLHLKGLKEASETFRQAYERNHREESLREYLYTIKLSNDSEQLKDRLVEYQVEQGFYEEITNEMNQMLEVAEGCEGMKELLILKKWKMEGRMSEFHKKAEEILEIWISSLRQI